MIRPEFQIEWHCGDDYPEWGSSPRRPLVQFDGAHKGEWLESIIGHDIVSSGQCIYHIVKCELCIAIHAWPLPSKDDLKMYYERQFYQVDKSDMVCRYNEDRFWWEKCTYNPLLQTCLEYAPHAKRILDIGSGPGICLDTALTHGFTTYGIEPNTENCDVMRTRGHIMLNGTLDDIKDCDREIGFSNFDIVVAYETLEHSPEPEDFLLRCYDMLIPGGILVVAVPNDYNPLQLQARKTLGFPSYWLAPPQHLFYFTPKMLQLLVRRCGFDIVDMRGTFPMEKFLLDGKNYTSNSTLGRKCHKERMQEELFVWQSGLWEAREEQYRMNLSEKRIGREIICFARKP